MWDVGTRVYVKLDPVFKGTTCGLCGDYDGNAMNDLKTRQGKGTEFYYVEAFSIIYLVPFNLLLIKFENPFICAHMINKYH